MLVPQKSQYALRALVELAKRSDLGPIKVADIAESQGIPSRFLGVIMSELRQAGFVESHRGKEGGYSLQRASRGLKVGEVLEYLDGPALDVDCLVGDHPESCALCEMWARLDASIRGILDTTVENLVENERKRGPYVHDYAI